MEGENTQLRDLHYKRGSVKSQLTLFSKFIEKFNPLQVDNLMITNLQRRLNTIEPLLEKFEQIQCEIELINHDLDDNLSVRESFQNVYFDLTSRASDIISQFNNTNFISCEQAPESDANSVNSKVSQNSPKLNNVRLPRIDLPSFDGTFTKWRQFSDSFAAMIHNNFELSNCQKLCYLRASLKGEPLNMLSALDTIDANYTIAWESLYQRYNDKNRIINNHVNAILNTNIISKESHTKLRQFIDTIQNHVQCLKSLGVQVEYWDAIILPILLNKLDAKTVSEWVSQINAKNAPDELPTYNEFIIFLNKRQITLETIELRNISTCKEPTASRVELKSIKQSNSYAVTNIVCPNCKGNHFIQNCESFLKLDATERFERIKSLKLCTNCLRKGHFVTTCQSSRCRMCHKRHHTTLHLNINNKTKTDSNSTTMNDTVNCVPKTTNLSSILDTNQILLSTAQINAFNSHGNVQILRVLLDSASQSNFITDRACKALGLKSQSTRMSVIGINQNVTSIQTKTNLKIGSRHNNFKTEIECFILPKITSALPSTTINLENFKIPPNLKLADPNFYQSKEIDMLIGASLFWTLLSVGQIKQKGTILQKTKFGWVVSGPINTVSPRSEGTYAYFSLTDLHNELQEFWKVDEFIQKRTFLTPDEELCESLFKETTTRDAEGRFIVKFPFKGDINDLGDSFDIAKSRLSHLENKFSRDSGYKNLYANCINDYKSQKHASVASSNSENYFFLPHHAVLKESRETTKIRVVFDGSCKPADGLSINQLQLAGPTIQDDLFSIITRFRTHEYVITADIAQMYRQIWMHPDDTKYQKFLWRDNPNNSIEILELKTVTFGMKSAPFLAIRCLVELANINQNSYPIESQIILRDFYVDDVLTGAKSLEELETIKCNLVKILKQGGFQLRKFKSNHPKLNESDKQDESTPLTEHPNKALGVYWNPRTDNFFYTLATPNRYTEVTKRTILSMTSQLFDPMGLLAPIIIIPKMIIQEIWQLNLSWDETIPANLHTKWLEFNKELNLIKQISIPRFILVPNVQFIEMHGFADASERAYGACIYLKSKNVKNETVVHLLAAKSRVAPTKNVSLPRLELLAAVLLTQLMARFKGILKITINCEYYWSDSQIVLCWIKSHPSKWVTFVANRVALIQELTNQQNWYHVRSNDNPADIISRGMLPKHLINCDLWWNGPNWLLNNSIEFEDSLANQLSENIPESKQPKKTCLVTYQNATFKIENFSSLNNLQRVIAWCIRFKQNCSIPKTERNYDSLNPVELNYSLIILIRITQMQSFSTEYSSLLKQNTIHVKSSLVCLHPFLDENGLIRVGGRLAQSEFKFDKRHPILLPKNNHLTKLIFAHEHLRLLHAGPNLLLSTIREKFWPISGRNIAKHTVRSCITCFRYNSTPNNPMMGNLPKSRTTPMPPFHTVGVDYAGPLQIKNKVGRGAKYEKCWISLFVCFTTKAIHLEPVTSLSKDAFLAAFRRFVARRGKPLHVYSDNGTNFLGANNDLINFYKWLNVTQTDITDSLYNQGVSWHFSPPHSPHFGGLWEAGVKSTKYHLKRVLCEASLTFEDLYTVLTQIEATLNSRPLSPITSDPNDLQALTPAHFLIGRPYTSVADPNVMDLKLNRLSRYQYLQRLNQNFWTRWSTEYVSQLQHRCKWKNQSHNIKVGSLVLIKDDNQPPCNWRLGRVMTLHPGKDQIVRVVTVKCTSGVFKRPVVKLCVLPIDITN